MRSYFLRPIGVVIACGLIWSPAIASASSSGPAHSTVEAADLERVATGLNSRAADRSPQVRKVRFLPVSRALAVARQAAFEVYIDPSMTWTGYGAGACRRLRVNSVRCLSYVDEYVADYADTYICGWYTTVNLNSRGRLGATFGQPECFWESEL